MPFASRRSRRWAVLVGLAVLIAVALVVRSMATGVDPAPAPSRIVDVIRPPASPQGPVRRSKAAAEPDRPRASGPEPEDELRGTVGTPIVELRRGRRVRLHDRPGGEVIARMDDGTDFGSPTVLSVRRVRGRWLGVVSPDLPNGDLGWLRADPGRLLDGHTDVRVEVDLSSHRASVWEGDELLRRWTVTVGASDSPTPTGTFAVTDLIKGGLNPAYGCCAVALTATQPHLPSGWKGGDRIAFHGTDGQLGADASSGCIRSADVDVRALIRMVPLGAPVKIHD
jgi:hypothetical protein